MRISLGFTALLRSEYAFKRLFYATYVYSLNSVLISPNGLPYVAEGVNSEIQRDSNRVFWKKDCHAFFSGISDGV